MDQTLPQSRVPLSHSNVGSTTTNIHERKWIDVAVPVGIALSIGTEDTAALPLAAEVPVVASAKTLDKAILHVSP